MAIYHLSVKPVSRSAGRSATAAAAYRSGGRIDCEREGRTHDYTRKNGIEHCEIFAPDSATWANDRSTLWNAAEAAEKRKNSTVAREYEVAIPDELNAKEKVELAREFARSLSERYSVAADVAIHAPHRDGDTRNWHAHILTTTRRATAEGLTEKTRELDDKKTGPEQVKEIRALWENMANRALERSHSDARIDCRSLEDQRTAAVVRAAAHEGRGETERAFEAKLEVVALERPAQAHLGPKVNAMERKTAKQAQRLGVEYQPATDRGHEFAEVRRAQIERFNVIEKLRTAFNEVKEAAKAAGINLVDFWRMEKSKAAHGALQGRKDHVAQQVMREGMRKAASAPTLTPEREKTPQKMDWAAEALETSRKHQEMRDRKDAEIRAELQAEIARAPEPARPFLAGVDLGTEDILAVCEQRVVKRFFEYNNINAVMQGIEQSASRMFRNENAPEAIQSELRSKLTEPRADYEKFARALIDDAERFGGLKGKDGFFSGKAAKSQRAEAEGMRGRVYSAAGDLKEAFDQEVYREAAKEQERRKRIKVSLPFLSEKTKKILLTIGDLRRLRPDSPEFETLQKIRSKLLEKLATHHTGDEIAHFAKACEQRFGGGSTEPYLPNGIKLSKEDKELITAGCNEASILNHHANYKELQQALEQKLQPEHSSDLGLSR